MKFVIRLIINFILSVVVFAQSNLQPLVLTHVTVIDTTGCSPKANASRRIIK